MNRRQRQRRDDRRAVSIRDDRPSPIPIATLRLEHAKVPGIHFRDDERHVGSHAVILRVREDRLPGPRKGQLCFPGDTGVERGEDDLRRHDSRITGHDGLLGDLFRHLPWRDPAYRLAIRTTRGPLRRRNLGDLEPRMVLEQPNERLSNSASRAEDGHWRTRAALFRLGGRRRDHVQLARSDLTMRSYESTAARSSRTSMYSSGVWAT